MTAACHSQVARQVRGAPVFRDEGEEREDGDREQVVVEHGCDARLVFRYQSAGHITGANIQSQSLKFIFLMTLRIVRTYDAVQNTFMPIQAYPAFRVDTLTLVS